MVATAFGCTFDVTKLGRFSDQQRSAAYHSATHCYNCPSRCLRLHWVQFLPFILTQQGLVLYKIYKPLNGPLRRVAHFLTQHSSLSEISPNFRIRCRFEKEVNCAIFHDFRGLFRVWPIFGVNVLSSSILKNQLIEIKVLGPNLHVSAIKSSIKGCAGSPYHNHQNCCLCLSVTVPLYFFPLLVLRNYLSLWNVEIWNMYLYLLCFSDRVWRMCVWILQLDHCSLVSRIRCRLNRCWLLICIQQLTSSLPPSTHDPSMNEINWLNPHMYPLWKLENRRSWYMGSGAMSGTAIDF